VRETSREKVVAAITGAEFGGPADAAPADDPTAAKGIAP